MNNPNKKLSINLENNPEKYSDGSILLNYINEGRETFVKIILGKLSFDILLNIFKEKANILGKITEDPLKSLIDRINEELRKDLSTTGNRFKKTLLSGIGLAKHSNTKHNRDIIDIKSLKEIMFIQLLNNKSILDYFITLVFKEGFFGHTEKLLLIKNNDENTILHLLLLKEYNDFIDNFKQFLTPDILSIQNNDGNTILHLLLLKNYNDLGKFKLLVNSVNINLQNNNGDTILHLLILNYISIMPLSKKNVNKLIKKKENLGELNNQNLDRNTLKERITSLIKSLNTYIQKNNNRYNKINILIKGYDEIGLYDINKLKKIYKILQNITEFILTNQNKIKRLNNKNNPILVVISNNISTFIDLLEFTSDETIKNIMKFILKQNIYGYDVGDYFSGVINFLSKNTKLNILDNNIFLYVDNCGNNILHLFFSDILVNKITDIDELMRLCRKQNKDGNTPLHLIVKDKNFDDLITLITKIFTLSNNPKTLIKELLKIENEDMRKTGLFITGKKVKTILREKLEEYSSSNINKYITICQMLEYLCNASNDNCKEFRTLLSGKYKCKKTEIPKLLPKEKKRNIFNRFKSPIIEISPVAKKIKNAFRKISTYTEKTVQPIKTKFRVADMIQMKRKNPSYRPYSRPTQG